MIDVMLAVGFIFFFFFFAVSHSSRARASVQGPFGFLCFVPV